MAPLLLSLARVSGLEGTASPTWSSGSTRRRGTWTPTHVAVALLGGAAQDQAVREPATAFPDDLRKLDAGEFQFHPLITLGDGATDPPPLGNQPDSVVELWAVCAARAHAPFARAHLYDLCFLRRQGKAGLRARHAVEAYLACAEAEYERLDQADHLERALESEIISVSSGL